MSTHLSPGQVIKASYDETKGSFKVEPASGQLITEKFDFIGADFPDSVTETYTYKSGGASGTTVATVTVVYTSSAKIAVSSVTKV